MVCIIPAQYSLHITGLFFIHIPIVVVMYIVQFFLLYISADTPLHDARLHPVYPKGKRKTLLGSGAAHLYIIQLHTPLTSVCFYC